MFEDIPPEKSDQRSLDAWETLPCKIRTEQLAKVDIGEVCAWERKACWVGCLLLRTTSCPYIGDPHGLNSELLNHILSYRTQTCTRVHKSEARYRAWNRLTRLLKLGS